MKILSLSGNHLSCMVYFTVLYNKKHEYTQRERLSMWEPSYIEEEILILFFNYQIILNIRNVHLVNHINK